MAGRVQQRGRSPPPQCSSRQQLPAPGRSRTRQGYRCVIILRKRIRLAELIRGLLAVAWPLLPGDDLTAVEQVEKDEFDQITDKHIPQRPMGAVEGASYTLVIVGGELLACPRPQPSRPQPSLA